MEPNIKNYPELKRLIKDDPRRADELAFEWQRFLKTNVQSSPELYSIENSDDFHKWAAEHPEKKIDTTVWVGKDISEAYYYLREEDEDIQMRQQGKVNPSSIPHSLAAAPILAASFMQKPKVIENDGHYRNIEYKLKKEWLKNNPDKSSSSKEYLDYVYGSLDDKTRVSQLKKEAEEAFRNNPKYQKRVEGYDRERKKIYKKQTDDPKWQAHEYAMREEIESRTRLLEETRDKSIKISKEEIAEEQRQLSMRVGAKCKEDFIQNDFAKAKEYFSLREDNSMRVNVTQGVGGETLNTFMTQGAGGEALNTSPAQQGPSIVSGAPSRPSSLKTPQSSRTSKGINALNNLMRGGIKNPLGKFGTNAAMKGLLAFLTSNPWVLGIIITLVVVVVFTFVIVGFGGVPSTQIDAQSADPTATLIPPAAP
jgi:hypothetical protein